MEKSFFRSKEFAIAAIVAALVLAGAVAAFSGAIGGGALRFERHACKEPALAGTAIPVTPSDTTSGSGPVVERTIVYELSAGSLAGGRSDLCVSVGDLLVEPSTDGKARLTITIHAEGAGARDLVEAADVRAKFASSEGGLVANAWQANSPRWENFFGDRSVGVHLRLELPATGAYAIKADTDVGDVEVEDLMLADSRFTTDVGDVALKNVDLAGNLSAATDVGEIDARLASVGPGDVTFTTDVGSVHLDVPARADVGYAVTAKTDVGDVSVDIGETDVYREHEDTPGARVEAKSKAYDAKPTKVNVRATTDVGSIRINAQ